VIIDMIAVTFFCRLHLGKWPFALSRKGKQPFGGFPMIWIFFRPSQAWIALWVLWVGFLSGLENQLLGGNPPPPSSQYVIRTWEIEQGLPRNTVYSVAQTADGYIWVGTSKGLLRFNGHEFELFDTNREPALEVGSVNVLHPDPRHGLWIGTEKSSCLCRREGRFVQFDSDFPMRQHAIRSILTTRRDGVLLGTSYGLYTLDSANRWVPFGLARELNTNSIQALAEDDQLRLWIGTKNGLLKWENGQTEWIRSGEDVFKEYIFSLVLDREGALWMGTDRGLFRRQTNGIIQRFEPEQGFRNSRIRSLFCDPDGTIWVGTYQGFYRWHEGRFLEDSFPATQALVHGFFLDREGAMWIATDDGLMQLLESRFTYWGVPEGVEYPEVLTVLEDQSRRIWMGTFLGGLYCASDGQLKRYTVKDGLSYNIVTALMEDRSQNLWIGTRQGSVDLLKEGRITSLIPTRSLGRAQVSALAEDRENSVWIGTAQGLHRWSQGRLEAVLVPFFERPTSVRVIQVGLDGRLWFGTSRGLVCRDQGQWKAYTTAQGLPSDEIRAIHEDRHGGLWVGTGSGLARWTTNGWQAYRKQDGLVSNEVLWMTDDDDGHLWLASSTGLFRIPVSAFADYDRALIPALPVRIFTSADGLRSRECKGVGQPAGWKDREGRIWIATKKGLAGIAISSLKAPVEMPIHIERILVDDRRLDSTRPQKLAAGARRFEFHFAALNYRDPAHVTCHYRLVGIDPDWIRSDSRRKAAYANLGPGRYRFQVKADRGLVSDQNALAEFAFVVEPHFYQTPFFYAATGGGLCVGIWGLYRWRIRSLSLRQQRLEELVQARTEELQREIDERLAVETHLRHVQKLEAVGQLAAGVAHDFNNILTVIQGHTGLLLDNPQLTQESADSLKDISEATQRAADLTRQLLAFSRRQIMRPEPLDLNQVLAQTSKMLHRLLGEPIQLTLAPAADPIPVFVDRGMMEQLLMNLAVNARDAMPRGGTLRVAIERVTVDASRIQKCQDAREGQFACLSVADTGVGMDEETVYHIFEPFFTTKEVGKGTGLGLATVYGIVKQHQGWIEVDSKIHQGSVFQVFLPLSEIDPASGVASNGQTTSRGGQERILIVEDDPGVRTLARGVLHRLGYRVIVAQDGVEALQLWREHQGNFDLVVTDLVMPRGLSGREMAEQLLADKPSLKVIYSTGYSVDLDRFAGSLREGVNFLPKPYPPDALASAVRRQLDS